MSISAIATEGGPSDMARKYISQRVRFEVLKRDGFACIYCGHKAPAVKLVIDHIEPFSKGGSDEIGNYATACHDCNAGKAANEVLTDSAPWMPIADRLCETLCDLMDRVPPLQYAIAVEVATLAIDGPAEGIPFEHMIDIVCSDRLVEHVDSLGIEDPREAFLYEAFGLCCWLEIVAKRQELGLPKWVQA